jgi:D-sedoheptulose 7-phosphate isomerase
MEARMSYQDVIEGYAERLVQALNGISQKEIGRAVDLLYEAWQRNATVFLVGNGGSASTASHFACDLAKLTIVKGQKRFRVMGLTDNVPLVSAWTNDDGFGSIFAEQMEPWFREGDVLIGISVHGGSGSGNAGAWSQNLGRAVRLAKERGGKVLGLSGFGGGVLGEISDVCLTVPVDSEPLGTPLVESIHVALHHMICVALQLRLSEEAARAI